MPKIPFEYLVSRFRVLVKKNFEGRGSRGDGWGRRGRSGVVAKVLGQHGGAGSSRRGRVVAEVLGRREGEGASQRGSSRRGRGATVFRIPFRIELFSLSHLTKIFSFSSDFISQRLVSPPSSIRRQ